MRLPQLTAKELIKILQREGFVVMRQAGSHVFLRHENGLTTVVPNHSGEKLDRGLLNKILKRDVKISREKFIGLYK
ncbi:MAG: type II toxin-antitoxin system HicA family toxin [Nanoarchaeota archaeon]